MKPELFFFFPAVRWIAVAFLFLPAARGDDGLRLTLERTYYGWSGAMLHGNLGQWEAHTAAHRRAMTRNFVVSRKEKWPDALFSLPFHLPEIATLNHLATFRNGDTANLIYFGKVDFGVPGGQVPNNLLMLRFVREEGGWKFDNTRFFNLESDPAVRQLAAAGELEFLSDPEFQPTGVVPPVPRIITGFDHPGEVWIASAGYETTVTIGDLHETTIADNVVTSVVIGGLSRSGLPVTVRAKELPVPPGEERVLAVEIYALRPDKPACKVWQFRPEPGMDLGEAHVSKVYANAVTMKD